jgi:hypothetical protein
VGPVPAMGTAANSLEASRSNQSARRPPR